MKLKKQEMPLSPDPKCLDHNPKIDWLGNNAAFTCPVCDNVFIVAHGGCRYVDKPQQEKQGERKCPHCKQSIGHVSVEGRKKTYEENASGRAWIEWPVEEEEK